MANASPTTCCIRLRDLAHVRKNLVGCMVVVISPVGHAAVIHMHPAFIGVNEIEVSCEKWKRRMCTKGSIETA